MLEEGQRPKKKSAWPWAFYVTAVGLLGWGQVRIFAGEFLAGGLLAAAGVFAAFLGLVFNEIPWGWLAFWRWKLPERAPRPQAAPGVESVRRRIRFSLPWNELSFSRHWMLVPVFGLLALMQWSILKGSVTRSSFLLIAAFLLLWVYLQNFGRRIMLPNLKANLAALVGLLAGLPFHRVGTDWRVSASAVGRHCPKPDGSTNAVPGGCPDVRAQL